MTRYIVAVSLAALWFAFLWAVFAFVSLVPNPIEWTEFGRLALVSIWVIPVFSFIMAAASQ